MGNGRRPAFEILEHTADIGLRAWGETRERLFENCALGVAEIVGRQGVDSVSGPTAERLAVELGAPDVEALLVRWMDEVLFLLEASAACLMSSKLLEVRDTGLRAELELVPCTADPEGTELKATTYHQLSVRPVSDGWEATVYFDV